MKQTNLKKRKQLVYIILLFIVEIYILQYSSLNILHGRSDAPVIVGIFGILALIICLIYVLNLAAISTLFGYIIALLIAMVFNTNGVDYGGGATNNLWQIWLLSFWAIILISLAINIVRIKKDNT